MDYTSDEFWYNEETSSHLFLLFWIIFLNFSNQKIYNFFNFVVTELRFHLFYNDLLWWAMRMHLHTLSISSLMWIWLYFLLYPCFCSNVPHRSLVHSAQIQIEWHHNYRSFYLYLCRVDPELLWTCREKNGVENTKFETLCANYPQFHITDSSRISKWNNPQTSILLPLDKTRSCNNWWSSDLPTLSKQYRLRCCNRIINKMLRMNMLQKATQKTFCYKQLRPMGATSTPVVNSHNEFDPLVNHFVDALLYQL